MISQDALTRVFLQQWGKSIDDVNLALYSRSWWQSIRVNQNTFRLSEEGVNFLTNTLELASYEIPFTESVELSPQTIIFLERYLISPYFLTSRSIIVFSERASFELYFFSDDIRKYGLIKAMKERQKESGNSENEVLTG